MKFHPKSLYTIFFIIVTCSTACIDGRDTEEWYSVEVKNESSSAINMLAYFKDGFDLEDSIVVRSGETGVICAYKTSGWAGFACRFNLLEFRFENNKGYKCIREENGLNISDTCFVSGLDPFNIPRPAEGSTSTLLIITENDFENAFDL